MSQEFAAALPLLTCLDRRAPRSLGVDADPDEAPGRLLPSMMPLGVVGTYSTVFAYVPHLTGQVIFQPFDIPFMTYRLRPDIC
mgnify:CR=1 FL=1